MFVRRDLMLFGLWTFAVLPAFGAVRYVDGEIAASGNGLSWATAKKTFLEARNSAAPGDEIWMKRGRYVGTVPLGGPYQVYGGFAGTETERSQRDWVKNRTVLDANGMGGGAVVTFRAGGGLVDGFDITGGVSAASAGGGVDMFAASGGGVLRNCRVYGNTASEGAGLSVVGPGFVVEDCTFTRNTATGTGGGAVSIGGLPASNPVFRRCVISANSAGGASGTGTGGGVRCSTAATFEDCTIVNNLASRGGGVALVGEAGATFRRCVLSGNVNGPSSYGGGALYAEATTATVPHLFENCLLTGNENGSVGAAAFLSMVSPSFVNCTFSGNVTANAGAVFLTGESSPAMTNCIFSGHRVWAIQETSAASNPVLTNCLFYGNQTDFRDGGTTSVNGATALNALPGCSGNVSGNPLYVWQTPYKVSGQVQSKAWDAGLKQTTITLTQPVLRPGALAGKLVKFIASSQRETLVYANTAQEVVVADVDGTVQSSTYTAAQNHVVLMDYHLTTGSLALDLGTAAGAPLEDLEGNVRPVNIPGAGKEDPADCFDIGALELEAVLPAECGGGARITFPSAGRRIGGNRVLVRAGMESTSCLALVNQITFEYRPAGSGAWTPLPGDPQHPNADLTQPFFVHWDVSALPDGDYDLRAVAVMGGVTDPAPAFVTVTVDSGHGRGRQVVNGAGEAEARAAALPAAETVLALGDVTGEVVASVVIPDGALTAETTLTAVIRDPAAFAGTYGAFTHPDAFLQLELESGQTVFAGGKKATLVWEYPDTNGDGLVDGTGMPETLLQAHWLDGGHWRPLPGSRVDPEGNTIAGETEHFSMFSLFPGALPVALSGFAVE